MSMSPDAYKSMFGDGNRAAIRARSTWGSGLGSGWGGNAYEASSVTPSHDQPFQWYQNTADNEVSESRERVTAWVRHLGRNNPKVMTLLMLRAQAVVGANLRLEAHPMFNLLGRDDVWADDWSQEVQNWFKMWGSDDLFRCDAHMSMNWGTMAKLAYSYWDTEGECLAVVRAIDRGGTFMTCVEIVDPERLSNPYGKSNFMLLENGNRVIDGVEVNPIGAPVAYHIRVVHECESLATVDKHRWERIPRFNSLGRPNVIHAVCPRRASQRRGISRFASTVSTVKRYDQYERGNVKAMENHARMFPYLESAADTDDLESALPYAGNGDDDPRSIYEQAWDYRNLHKGKIDGTELFQGLPGEKVHALRGELVKDPAAFIAVGDKQLAGVAGVAHPVGFNAWGDVTYSSGQMMLAILNRGEVQDCDEFSSKFARPVYSCVLEEMIASGKVKPARRRLDFYSMRTAYTNCRFIGPGNIVGDPVKEGLGAEYRLMHGMASVDMILSERGYDPDEVRRAIAANRRRDIAAGNTGFMPIKGIRPDAEADSAATGNQEQPPKKPDDQVNEDDA